MNAKTKRALSPLLATVVLLGVTVAAGGAVFSVYNQQAKGLDSNMSLRVDNAQGVVTTEHGDFTATITNTGTQAWSEVSIALHTGLGEHPPLLYIHGEEIGEGLLPKLAADDVQEDVVLYLGTDLVASTEALTVDVTNDVNDCGTVDATEGAAAGVTQYSKDIDPVGPGEQISMRMHMTIQDNFDDSCNAQLDGSFGTNKWYAKPGETVMMIVSVVGDQGAVSEKILGLPIRTI